MGHRKLLANTLCLRVGLAVSLLAIVLPAEAGYWMTPEFSRDEERPLVLALLPPRAEVMQDKVASMEQMIHEGAKIEDAAGVVVTNTLTGKGYQIRPFTNDEINSDPVLKDLTHRFNERYDDERQQILQRKKDVRSRRFTCGEEAEILATKLGVDGIVVVRIHASGASGGQKMMAALIGGSSGYTTMDISILAADTGDVEAYFDGLVSGTSDNDIVQKPEKVMAKVSKKTFKKFPKTGETVKVKKSWPQNTRKEPEATQSEDEMLAELEALLGDGGSTGEGAEVPADEIDTIDETGEEAVVTAEDVTDDEDAEEAEEQEPGEAAETESPDQLTE